jgi:hypothetical protein
MLENPCLTVFLTKMLLEDPTYRFPIAHSSSSKRFVLFLLAVLGTLPNHRGKIPA